VKPKIFIKKITEDNKVIIGFTQPIAIETGELSK
jgi:hypothetical protein